MKYLIRFVFLIVEIGFLFNIKWLYDFNNLGKFDLIKYFFICKFVNFVFVVLIKLMIF